MTICIPITGQSFEEIHNKINQAAPQADLLEFRMDLWHPSIDIHKAIALTDKPKIITLRSEKHGGRFSGTPQEYSERIKLYASLSPEYLDVEFGQAIPEGFPSSKVILSFHEFDKPIDDISGLINEMRKTPAKIYKIAMICNTTLDALRLLNTVKGPDTIAIGMGEFGQISRILQPIYCSGITFAVMHSEEAIAPGQLSVYELDTIYKYRSLNPKTKVYGLIGNPVEKSMGHVIHNRAFKKYGEDAVYVKMNIAPEMIPDFLAYAEALHFKGCSVTMPLKEVAARYMNELSKDAAEIKAINTIVFEEGRLKGYNFDGVGAVMALEMHKPVHNSLLVILGAGGAAKAIGHEASKKGAHVKMLTRSLNNLSDVNKGYDFLINATPSPMPIPVYSIIPRSIVMDVAVRPRYTELLHQASLKDCTCVYGYQMWVNQACGQWRVWFPLKNTEGLLSFLNSEYESLLE